MRGDTKVITKRVACPHCNNKTEVHGKPDEIAEITCPKCNTKDSVSFKKDISLSKKKIWFFGN